MKLMDIFSEFFFFSFLAAPRHMEFLGQGSDLSCGFHLHHNCGNARSLNPLYRARDRTCVLVLQSNTDSIVPQWERLRMFLMHKVIYAQLQRKSILLKCSYKNILKSMILYVFIFMNAFINNRTLHWS